MPPRQSVLPIATPTHAAPLSAQQAQFNEHLRRIAAQQELLAAWNEATAAFHARYARDVEPLLATYHALYCELAQVLDAEAGRKGLSKADRAALGEAIARLAARLAAGVRDEALRAAMQALHDRYANADEAAPDTADPDSPEEVLRRVEAQMHAAQAQAEQARAAHHAERRARKPGARERQAQAAAREAAQPLREIYRRLASTLHPDRESDPAERTRKTALMQRVNLAYAAGDLTGLLQLQLEADQIDPARIAAFSDARLAPYNRLLADQLAELLRQTRAAQEAFCADYGLEPGAASKPAKLMGHLRAQVRDLQEDIQHLRLQLRALREEPDALRHWLRHARAA